jgi:broad specificity phosphatase PhoE
MTTEILVIRHAQTDHNREQRFQGHATTPLNAHGQEQARLLAQRLARGPVEAIYSSDLPRAHQTAAAVASSLSLPIFPLRGLREIDVGEAVGLTRDELRKRQPDLFGPAWASARFPGGESHEELGSRIGGTLRDLAAAHPQQRIAVVTHGGAIRALLAAVAGIPLEALVGLVVANTSITRLRRTPDGVFRLLGLNDAAHLEEWAAQARNGHAENAPAQLAAYRP